MSKNKWLYLQTPCNLSRYSDVSKRRSFSFFCMHIAQRVSVGWVIWRPGAAAVYGYKASRCAAAAQAVGAMQAPTVLCERREWALSGMLCGCLCVWYSWRIRGRTTCVAFGLCGWVARLHYTLENVSATIKSTFICPFKFKFSAPFTMGAIYSDSSKKKITCVEYL